jgi:heptosyltransferase II
MIYDCKHFLGDRPCKFHKEQGMLCKCNFYEKIGDKILLIKVGNMGDVVRTTAILPGLKRKYPNSFVSWLTAPRSRPLLKGNPLIDRIYLYQWPDIERLKIERFDLVVCLDKEYDVSAVADQIKTRERKGFILDPEMGVTGYVSGAEECFLQGLDDKLKKQNGKSQQQIYCEIAGLDWRNDEYYINVPNVRPFEPVDVGLNYLFDPNTFRTRRWLYWEELELLFERNGISYSKQSYFPTVEEYIGWINSCKVVVSIDSLGLHLAIALRKKNVAIFSSTGYPEISLYGRGTKIIAKDLDCILCRKHLCADMACMKAIKPELVFDEVMKLLGDKVKV